MKYPIIAECVDRRDGSRLMPGATLESDDLQQIRDLVRAGCIPAKHAAAEGDERPAREPDRRKRSPSKG